MPGMAELIEGAVQQAPQCGRQFMRALSRLAFHLYVLTLLRYPAQMQPRDVCV
jgi:hypothetical protein